MTTESEILAALEAAGFERTSMGACGTWMGYPVALRRYAGKSWFAFLSVQLPKVPSGLRKTLNRAVKDPQVKVGGVERLEKNTVVYSIHFNKAQEVGALFSRRMDAITAALRENGVPPQNTCAITGASNPDSLCLISDGSYVCYRPVCASALRRQDNALLQQVEHNENSGNYGLGVIGAILGMLVGVLLNLLVMLLTKHIFALVFALVPLASMFGYKLFKGKMNKAALVIVIILCLIAIPLIPLLEIVYTLIQEYGFSFGEAISSTLEYFRTPGAFSDSDLIKELLQLLVFMGLGLLIAFRSVSGMLNTTALRMSRIQNESLRPNPNYRPGQAPAFSAEAEAEQ